MKNPKIQEKKQKKPSRGQLDSRTKTHNMNIPPRLILENKKAYQCDK